MSSSHSAGPTKGNLAERFRRVMETSQRAQEEPDYTKMTLEELGQSVITFGEAKKGQTYEKVLQGDQSYVTWFTTKFAGSQKYPHRRFLFYVQKFVEQAETIQVTAQPKSRPAPKSNPHMMVHLTDEDTPVPEVSDDENTYVGSHRGTASTDLPTGKPSEPEDQQSRSGDGTDRWTASGTDSSPEGRGRTVGSAAVTPICNSDTAGQVTSHDVPTTSTEVEECIDVEFFQDCFTSNHMTDNHIRHEMWSYWCKRFHVSNLQQVQQHFSRPGIDVLEVYCSQDSQLTHQCLNQGLSAARFSRKHGDLNTITGRHMLYDMLWQLRPKHIWVAPTCKPWCCWSRLNAAKSKALAQRIDQERRSENVHLLLCDALLHLQLWRSNDCHFHLEQPQGSELINQREMHQVMLHTFRAICDMCNAGKLHHPETGNPLRKRTQILTTSQIMYHFGKTAVYGWPCSWCHSG